MEKRTPQEKEKYQPSYDTTILSEVRRPLGERGGQCGAWSHNPTWLHITLHLHLHHHKCIKTGSDIQPRAKCLGCFPTLNNSPPFPVRPFVSFGKCRPDCSQPQVLYETLPFCRCFFFCSCFAVLPLVFFFAQILCNIWKCIITVCQGMALRSHSGAV